MTKEIIKIKRVESLPIHTRERLIREKDIIEGLVEIKISENSPKRVEDFKQATELFSDRWKNVFNKV